MCVHCKQSLLYSRPHENNFCALVQCAPQDNSILKKHPSSIKFLISKWIPIVVVNESNESDDHFKIEKTSIGHQLSKIQSLIDSKTQ